MLLSLKRKKRLRQSQLKQWKLWIKPNPLKKH